MRRIVALALALALVGVVAVTTTAGAQGSDRPGVTAKEIRVGGIAGVTNPIGQPYDSGFEGAKAYFNYINAKEGGAFGRKFKMVAERDDQSRASQNVTQCRALIEEDKVFAVLPVVTSVFACGQYLADQGVPTFGWNINAEWCGSVTQVQELNAAEVATGSNAGCDRLNFFGEKGSYLCFTCPQLAPAFVAQQIGATKVGVMAYTSPQSAECAKGQVAGYEKYGLDVVYEDTSLSFGFANLGDAIQQIEDSGVEFISACMDIAGEVNIARSLRRAGLEDIGLYAPQGYDAQTLEKYGDELNGFYFGVAFVPFETPNLAPGMKAFQKQMKKEGFELNEQALAGWMNAALLYEGITLAGEDFTRQSVVDAIGGITDWTADGIRPPIDWRAEPDGDAHGPGNLDCTAFLEAVDGKFEGRFGKKGQPFVCFPANPGPDTLDDPTYLPEKTG